MGWIILFVILAIVVCFVSNIKDIFEALLCSNSILSKFALTSLVSAIAAWGIHFFVLSQLMLELSKILFAAFIILVLIRLVFSIFSGK